jgi:hypothetical protein
VKIEVINGKQEFVDQGLQPVCEKNFMFEMTASIMMGDEGNTQKHMKIPSFLKSAFGTGNGYIGVETGKKIRQWLEQGEKEDPEIERIKSEALLTCEKGAVALTALWKSLTKDQQKNIKLISHFALCGESAKAYDAQNSDESGDDKIELIKKLYLEFPPLLKEDADFIKNVIDSADEKNYDMVIHQLKKANEQQGKSSSKANE